MNLLSLHRETLIFNYLTSNLTIYCIMEFFCKDCKSYFKCLGPLSDKMPNRDFSHSRPCIDFEFAKKMKYVALEQNLNTKNWIILGFSDSRKELMKIVSNRTGFEKNYYRYLVVSNGPVTPYELTEIKDNCILNICKNVAYALARGEYLMLKHKYTKSKFCFDRVKSAIVDACFILQNY